MENLGTKVVVLGVGSAGCRMLNQLASSNPNAELIAVDADKPRLESLNSSIKKVGIGHALTECKSPDGIRAFLSGEATGIESALSNAGMAIILANLGGRTASCLLAPIADQCSSKGIFTLIVAAYPLISMGGEEGMEAKARLLRQHSSGVVIIDNNLNLEKGGVPISEVFDKINSIINEFAILLINSVSGIGYMAMTADELMHFFHGDFYFALTAGHGSTASAASARAIEDVHRYMGHSGVKRMLLLVAGPAEVGLDELRALNDAVQSKYNPETIKWVGAYSSSDYSDLIAVSALSEMPLLQGVEQPASAAALGIGLEKKALEGPVAEAIEQASKAESEPAAEAVKPAETKRPEPVEKVPERLVEKKLERPNWPAPVFFDFKNLGLYKEAPPKKPFKSPALVGIGKEVEAPLQRDRAPVESGEKEHYDIYALGKSKGQEKPGYGQGREQDYGRRPEGDATGRDELSEMAEDLTGFPTEEIRPSYKKTPESQKRMKDYGSNLDDVKYV